jgi:hypothetical protein
MKHMSVLIAAYLFLGCSPKSTALSSQSTTALGPEVTGPSDYHTTYSNILDTIVVLRNFRIRTTDGQVISINTDPMELDLQDLQGVGKGLPLNLTGVTYPDGAETVDVAEIESDIVGEDARTISSNNAVCPLKTPSKLNFYTSAPITVIAGEQYFVKVNFSPLNSIQIDLVTEKKCGCEGEHERHRNSGHNGSKNHNRGHYRDDDCDESTATVKRCELVNRRQPITDIIRPVDEA